jgi:hypothetical protein
MDRVTRRRRMISLIELYNAGTESRADFCKHHRLPLSTFSWWQRQYRLSRKGDSQRATLPPLPFIRVLPPASSGVFELSLPDGCSIRFPSGIPSDEFIGLVSRLRAGLSCSA